MTHTLTYIGHFSAFNWSSIVFLCCACYTSQVLGEDRELKRLIYLPCASSKSGAWTIFVSFIFIQINHDAGFLFWFVNNFVISGSEIVTLRLGFCSLLKVILPFSRLHPGRPLNFGQHVKHDPLIFDIDIVSCTKRRILTNYVHLVCYM